MKCKHLVISEEAYCNDVAVPAFLCAWPTKHMSTAPAWVIRTVGGGLMVNPKLDCVGCSCFSKQVEGQQP